MDCLSLPDDDRGGARFRIIPAARLRPNPWNPNRVPPEKLKKLKEAVAEKGLLSPILVRPAPGGPERFEIIDGEHRFRIARSLGIDEIPCVVVRLSDAEAKVKTLQLNGLRGENEPEKIARMIRDLNLDYDLDELERMLPLDRYDLQASMDLLAVMERERPDAGLEEEMEKMLDEVIFSVVVTREQRSAIEHAIARRRKSRRDPGAGAECGPDRDGSDGRHLADICEAFLAGAP